MADESEHYLIPTIHWVSYTSIVLLSHKRMTTIRTDLSTGRCVLDCGSSS